MGGERVGNRNLRHITTAGEVFLFSMKGFFNSQKMNPILWWWAGGSTLHRRSEISFRYVVTLNPLFVKGFQKKTNLKLESIRADTLYKTTQTDVVGLSALCLAQINWHYKADCPFLVKPVTVRLLTVSTSATKVNTYCLKND